jgi:hypothetical protein
MPIQLYLPETRFKVLSIPLARYADVVSILAGIEGFVSMTRDKAEITLILAEPEWDRVSSMFPEADGEGRRRMIRFDTVLDFSVVGFIADISRALADAEISILSISTFQTDAILVHESRFDDAVAAVKQALVTMRYTYLSQL